jgi:hypothetical protein
MKKRLFNVKNKAVAKIVTKPFWTKKRTATLIVAIFVGLGIVAGLTGYYLTREKEAEAVKGTVWPNGGAIAENQSDFATLKIAGGKKEDGKYLQFTLGNRLGLHSDKWADPLKKNLGKSEGYIDMPLEVWDGKNWVDAFYYLLGKTGGKSGEEQKFLEATGLRIFWTKPGFVFKQTKRIPIGSGDPNQSYYNKTFAYYSASKLDSDPTLKRRWCVRIGFDSGNYNQVREKTFALNIDKFPIRELEGGVSGGGESVAKATQKIGANLLEYRTYFYHHSRAFSATRNQHGFQIVDATDEEKEGIKAGSFTGTLDEVKAAGRAGLSASNVTLNAAINQANHVVLTWDEKKSLNADKYEIQKRKKGESGWDQVKTVSYPGNRCEDSDIIQRGETYEYRLQAISYFDSKVRADSPIKTVTYSTGGGVTEPTEPTEPKGEPKQPEEPKEDIPEDVNLDGLVNWLDVAKVLAYNGFPGAKVGESSGSESVAKPVVREDVNRDGIVDWLDIGRILAYKGFPQTSSGSSSKTHEAAPAGGSGTGVAAPATEAAPAQ